ncbi:MAG: RluA family pseudouridine synthase [Alphaproteobacteria bacterium]|nr:RluA family pseudouridine synthase [Alphaproteobacteria bacterium]
MTEGIIVNEVDDGQRLDRWLKKHYPDVPFGQVQKILRTGQLRIDGKRVKGDARLVEGQVIRIPPQMSSPQPKSERGLSERDTEFIRSLVIYEDEHMIALNKPSGLAVQGGTKIKRHIDGLLDGLKNNPDDPRPHLVHRLDKDTSGVLLLARNPKAARALSDAFRGRDIRKYYWAVVAPAPQIDQGKISSALTKVETGHGERMAPVEDGEGKSALTYYSVIERLGKKLALVAFWPKTGRQHQIRVHAAQMGSPLLGDFKYDAEQAFLRETPDLPETLHLHARRVIMRHPITGKKLDITAPLDPEMKKTFKFFGFNADDKSDPFEELE